MLDVAGRIPGLVKFDLESRFPDHLRRATVFGFRVYAKPDFALPFEWEGYACVGEECAFLGPEPIVQSIIHSMPDDFWPTWGPV